MTAINEMIEYLKEMEIDSVGDFRIAYNAALVAAHRFASLEAKEKPTAPASLVEELENVCRVEPQIGKEGREYETELICKGRLQIKDRVKEIISHYRPQTDIVGELKECLSGDNDYFMHLNGEAMKNRAFIPKKMIEEIISKHAKEGGV